MGTVSATTSQFGIDNVLLVWVDAHADINTVKTTKTGNMHGCPVSFLIGHPDSSYDGPFGWLNHASRKANGEKVGHSRCFDHKNLVYIGLRDVEPEEKEILKEYRIKCYFMDEVKKRRRNGGRGGSVIDEIFEEFMNEIDPEGKKKIHVSFDVDGMDPSVTPSTGTPVPDGLSLEEGRRIVYNARQTGCLVLLI